jgi:ATP-dependent Clp protease ATP-binding subunit ClpC
MFERFTDRSRTVMNLASVEAARRADDSVDTVDVLVGMLREGKESVAWHVLSVHCSVSVDINLVLAGRQAVCDVSDVPLAEFVSQSLLEAKWLDHRYVGTEHLLLAVCALFRSRAARLLAASGNGPVQICSHVLGIVGRARDDELDRWLVDHPDAAQSR